MVNLYSVFINGIICSVITESLLKGAGLSCQLIYGFVLKNFGSCGLWFRCLILFSYDGQVLSLFAYCVDEQYMYMCQTVIPHHRHYVLVCLE